MKVNIQRLQMHLDQYLQIISIARPASLFSNKILYKENIHRPVMGESVERGWYDHRKIGQPSTSEASRAIKAAKMFMPVNPYLQILEKYIIYGTVFWYDDAAIYSKNFSKNGLERITCDLCLLRFLFLNTVSSCPRYRNFERLHSHLKDIPNYTLHLLPKRIFSSSTEYAFVHQHCIQLYKYLQDLLSIAKVAEQQEVWDFLSASSKSGVSIGYFYIHILIYMECGKGSPVDDCNNKSPFKGQNNLYQVSSHMMQCGFAQIFTWYLNSYDLDRPQQGSPMLVVGLSGGWIMFKAIDSEKLLSVLGRDLSVNVDDAVDDTVRQFKGVSDGLMCKVFGSPSSSSYDPTTSTSDRNIFWNMEEIHELALTQSNSESVNSFSDNDSSDKDGSRRDEEVGPSSEDNGWHSDNELNSKGFTPWVVKRDEERISSAVDMKNGSGLQLPSQQEDPVEVPPERIPADFLRHISEESPDRATLKCLSGGTWNVKLQCDGRGLAYTQRLEKFQKNNQLQNGEYLVFRYDGALQFTIRIFSKNGLERQVKSNMVKNQQASIYDGGSKHKRPEKYPYTSKFPKQTRAYCENGTEHATPRKRTGLDKEEDLLTDLTPNIPQFVKCLKGYNVKKSCFLYVPKSFCEQLPKSDNKTAGVLCNSEGKRWKDLLSIANVAEQHELLGLLLLWKIFFNDFSTQHVYFIYLCDESGVSIGYFYIHILVYMECGKGSPVDDCNNKSPFKGQNNLYQVSSHRMQCGYLIPTSDNA
ncbi:hypothetical protein KY284_003358 [Solanum tuberosum]|nr:hypothetical protein KY284_003358 [Solanum tuberosum]